eukprot:Seg1838.2 transcript_id=Seg1838.2/GoldUCD/mRNA.D3Y31 product="hypothetical protein" protein_id=Seg1838.2/GoldUCD/D3Y31
MVTQHGFSNQKAKCFCKRRRKDRRTKLSLKRHKSRGKGSNTTLQRVITSHNSHSKSPGVSTQSSTQSAWKYVERIAELIRKILENG